MQTTNSTTNNYKSPNIYIYIYISIYMQLLRMCVLYWFCNMSVYGHIGFVRDLFPIGVSAINGKTSHVWEVFPCMGRLPTYGKTSHIWEDFPCMGSPTKYGNTSHIYIYIWQHAAIKLGQGWVRFSRGSRRNQIHKPMQNEDKQHTIWKCNMKTI